MGLNVFKGSSSIWLEREPRRKADIRCEKQLKILCASFMMSDDSLFLKDLDFRYMAVSPEYCRHLGKGEAEILGRSDFDIFPRTDAVRQRIEDAMVLGVCCSKFVQDVSDSDEPRTLQYINPPFSMSGEAPWPSWASPEGTPSRTRR